MNELLVPPYNKMGALMVLQGLGNCVLQFAGLERTMIMYAALSLSDGKKLNAQQKTDILKSLERLGLGQLVSQMRREQVGDDHLLKDVSELRVERNRLIHRSHEQLSTSAYNEMRLVRILEELDNLSSRTIAVSKSVTDRFEDLVLKRGLTREWLNKTAQEILNKMTED